MTASAFPARPNADDPATLIALYRLIFRRELINDLMGYIDCKRAEDRRLHDNSFYGDSNENYVFLTHEGNP